MSAVTPSSKTINVNFEEETVLVSQTNGTSQADAKVQAEMLRLKSENEKLSKENEKLSKELTVTEKNSTDSILRQDPNDLQVSIIKQFAEIITKQFAEIMLKKSDEREQKIEGDLAAKLKHEKDLKKMELDGQAKIEKAKIDAEKEKFDRQLAATNEQFNKSLAATKEQFDKQLAVITDLNRQVQLSTAKEIATKCENEKLITEKNNLHSELKKLKGLAQDVTISNNTITNLNNQITGLKEASTAAAATLEQRKATIKDLNNKTQEALKAEKEAKEALTKKEATIERRNVTITGLNATITKRDDTIDDRDAEIRGLYAASRINARAMELLRIEIKAWEAYVKYVQEADALSFLKFNNLYKSWGVCTALFSDRDRISNAGKVGALEESVTTKRKHGKMQSSI